MTQLQINICDFSILAQKLRKNVIGANEIDWNSMVVSFYLNFRVFLLIFHIIFKFLFDFWRVHLPLGNQVIYAVMITGNNLNYVFVWK